MANRHTLAITKINAFRDWLIADGWEIQDTKGYYEVLRAKKEGRRHPLVVYERLGAKCHLSVLERDMGVVKAYMRYERSKIRIYEYEHNGYILQQSSYNNHYMIFEAESGKLVLHVSCESKLTEEEAKERIDLYILQIKGMEGKWGND